MAEVALPATTNITSPKATANSVGGVPQACDAGNGNSFANTGVELLVADNTGASSRTIIFRNAANVANVATITVAANKLQLIGPFDPNLFGSTVDFTASHAEIECRVVALAGGAVSNIITRR